MFILLLFFSNVRDYRPVICLRSCVRDLRFRATMVKHVFTNALRPHHAFAQLPRCSFASVCVFDPRIKSLYIGIIYRNIYACFGPGSYLSAGCRYWINIVEKLLSLALRSDVAMTYYHRDLVVPWLALLPGMRLPRRKLAPADLHVPVLN